MLKTLLVSASVLLFATLSVSAQQQNRCAPRDKIVEFLKEKHKEIPINRGTQTLRGQMVVIEYWGSDEKKSWTIVLTRPDKISCILGAGENFQRVPEEVLMDDEPT